MSSCMWEGVCGYPGASDGGFGGDGEFMTLTLPRTHVLAVTGIWWVHGGCCRAGA